MDSGMDLAARSKPVPQYGLAQGGETVLVSILLPAFNAEVAIGAAISSAQAQTLKQFEILVIDDGSTDRTGEIVRAAAGADKRIRYIRMEASQRTAAARSWILALARGRWIALLNAADSFHPLRLERLIALGERRGADIVSDNLLLCDWAERPDKVLIPHEQLAEEARLSAKAFFEGRLDGERDPRCNYGFVRPLFRRAFLGRHRMSYNDPNRYPETFLFYMECLARGAKWWVTPEPMYFYAVRSGSPTEGPSAAEILHLRVAVRQLLTDLKPTHTTQRSSLKADRTYYYRAFTDAIRCRRFDIAARLLFQSGPSFGYLIGESFRKAPAIVRQALEGSYRDKASLLVFHSKRVRVPRQ